MSIEINTDSSLVVHGKPEVVSPDYITFMRGGVEVGKVPATFDFKDLPPEFHAMAIQLIQQKRMRLYLPG